MTDKLLTAKQSSFVEYYCNPGSDTYNNAYQSATKAGYAETTAKIACKHILEYVRVIKAISRYKAKTKEKIDHDRTTAINLLTSNLNALRPLIVKDNIKDKPNIQAVQAATAIIRELDAISGLHSQTILTETPQDRAMDDK